MSPARLPLCSLLVATVASLKAPAPPPVARRNLLTSVAAAAALTTAPAVTLASGKPEEELIDYAAKSSFFGLAAPPILATWTYDTLVEEARAGNLASVQIAVSHDCVIAITTEGHRYACLMPDAKLPVLVLDAMDAKGNVPFEVLPLDANRAQVREGAREILNIMGVLWLADCFDVLPWDTTPYGSWAEREKAQEERAKGVSTKPARKALDSLLAAMAKKRGSPEDADDAAESEALQRVLGLVRPAAARPKAMMAEMKAIKSKSAAKMNDLKASLRPRGLERQLLASRPRQLENELIRTPPPSLRPRRERERVGGHPSPRQ